MQNRAIGVKPWCEREGHPRKEVEELPGSTLDFAQVLLVASKEALLRVIWSSPYFQQCEGQIRQSADKFLHIIASLQKGGPPTPTCLGCVPCKCAS